MKPAETIQLTETIKIVLVEEMPDCGEKEEIFRSRWKHKTNLIPAPSAALVAECTTDKICESITIDKIGSEYPNFEGEIFDCFRVC